MVGAVNVGTTCEWRVLVAVGDRLILCAQPTVANHRDNTVHADHRGASRSTQTRQNSVAQ